MKKKPGFNLRNVCGEMIIVPEGIENIDFTEIVSMSESAAYLWENIEVGEFTTEQLVALMTKEYEIDEETARKDIKEAVEGWLKIGICE